MKESKSVNSVKVGIAQIMRFPSTTNSQKIALEQVLIQLTLWEHCRENHKKRHLAATEEHWSIFLRSYLSNMGSRGARPFSYSSVEDVQKHLGRLVRTIV